MEKILIVGYEDGKDNQNKQHDTPCLTVMKVNSSTGDMDVQKVIEGDKAKRLYKKLTNFGLEV